jgi:hypothetical protein
MRDVERAMSKGSTGSMPCAMCHVKRGVTRRPVVARLRMAGSSSESLDARTLSVDGGKVSTSHGVISLSVA